MIHLLLVYTLFAHVVHYTKVRCIVIVLYTFATNNKCAPCVYMARNQHIYVHAVYRGCAPGVNAVCFPPWLQLSPGVDQLLVVHRFALRLHLVCTKCIK